MSATLPPRRPYALTATVLFFVAYAAVVALILIPKERFLPPHGGVDLTMD